MIVTTRVHIDTGDVRLEHTIDREPVDGEFFATIGIGGIVTPQAEIFAQDAVALDRLAAECTRAADALRAAEAVAP